MTCSKESEELLIWRRGSKITGRRTFSSLLGRRSNIHVCFEDRINVVSSFCYMTFKNLNCILIVRGCLQRRYSIFFDALKFMIEDTDKIITSVLWGNPIQFTFICIS